MSSQKLKIFISAYACEPNLGSEIGVGWNWVLQMSKYFDLWVLTRQSNKESIENWLKVYPIENNINFVYYDLPKKLRFWKKGLRGVRTYYILWQSLTNKIVKRTMEENGIEVYHLLTYGNALWPVSSYGQKKIFIWGPTATGNFTPEEFTKFYGFRNRLKEFLQRVLSKTLKYNIGYKNRCANVNLMLCKTESTLENIPEKYRHKALVFTDVAVEQIDTSNYQQKNSNEVIKYLAVGRLESWRGFDIMIEAFAIARRQNPNMYLDILGKGNDKDRLVLLIEKLQLKEYITLVGQVTKEEYYQFMADCDVVVNPTLKEGAVTVAFDSMSFAKPLICVSTGGYTKYFTNEYAVVLDMCGRKELVNKLANAIETITDKQLRKKMTAKIIEVRDNFIWNEKGKQIRDVILKSLNLQKSDLFS